MQAPGPARSCPDDIAAEAAISDQFAIAAWLAPPVREPAAVESVFLANAVMEVEMGKGLLLWLIGIPIPIIILVWLLGGLN